MTYFCSEALATLGVGEMIITVIIYIMFLI